MWFAKVSKIVGFSIRLQAKPDLEPVGLMNAEFKLTSSEVEV
jgi:hypothetical protein